MNNKSLAVITIARNDPHGFALTAKSLQIQASSEYVWIVVDGSDDIYSEEMYSIFEAANIKNSIFLKREALGIYDAMNYALNYSQSDWLVFLNCGDYFYSDKSVSNSLRIINLNPDAVLIAFSVAIRTIGGYFLDIVRPRLVQNGRAVYANMNHQGVFIRRESALFFGGFDMTYKFAADSNLLDKVVSVSNPIMEDSVCSVFTIGGSSGSNFRKTLSEISLYRSNVPKGIRKQFLILRTILRLKVLNKCLDTHENSVVKRYLEKRHQKYVSLADSL
jgi:glycosyltransferase involved in cell wall biosynthesis